MKDHDPGFPTMANLFSKEKMRKVVVLFIKHVTTKNTEKN